MRQTVTVNGIFKLLATFNLLIAFGAIWSLQRIGPEVQRIYQRNVVSLGACEEMLSAMSPAKIEMVKFSQALARAESNITEKGEKEALNKIKALLPELEADQKEAIKEVVGEIVKISAFNKKAVADSVRKAQRFQQAGAWCIVFLTLLFFLLALYFGRRFRRRLLLPIEELHSAVDAFLGGDKMRRCNMPFAEDDMKKIFKAVNELMDRLCRFL
ncbi:MAG: hypothetical protein IKS20_05845 [Victivallales bacterium]|nr:hypothetical protein [Victivallales bacterium]